MINQLSPEQLLAVNADDRAIVVAASAGSGKTEVVAQRVERLLMDSAGESFRILAVSYTVKAADELDERLRERVGDIRRVDAETIHAFAHNLVRQHGTWEGLPPEPEVLHHDEDRIELLMGWLTDAGQRLHPTYAGEVLRAIDVARARLEDARYLDAYNEALLSRGALDYPAMLEVATRLLERDWVRTQLAQMYRHLIVDEAQNLTLAQYQLLTSVLGAPPSDINAMLVGDEKQSIVQFAGADPQLIRRFERDYDARRIELTQNFRSATAVAAVADSIADHLGDEERLQVASAAPGNVQIEILANEQAEGGAVAGWIADLLGNGLPAASLAPGESTHVVPEEIAVLARSGATLRWTADALDRAGIGYMLASDARSWMSSTLGQAVVDLVAFRAGPDHRSARAHLRSSAGVDVDSLETSPVEGLATLVSQSDAHDPAELFGAVTNVTVDPTFDPQWADDKALLVQTWQRFLDRTAPIDRSYPALQVHIARTQRGEPTAPGVRLLTVHKSQGREFRAVSIVGLNDGQFPDFRQTTLEERRAELHCFYVAVTRASRLLRLSRARLRHGRNGPWAAQESGYLALVREALARVR